MFDVDILVCVHFPFKIFVECKFLLICNVPCDTCIFGMFLLNHSIQPCSCDNTLRCNSHLVAIILCDAAIILSFNIHVHFNLYSWSA